MGQGDEDFMATAFASLTCRVAPREQLLLNCVESAARAANRPSRPLHLQALLHLPRSADTLGFVPLSMLESFLAELAQELPDRGHWLLRDGGFSPRLLHFHKVEPDKARDVTQRFHYLRSPRTDGRAYGLSTGAGHLVALCVSSPLDVETLSKLLASHGRPTESARVVSRVFAFEGAPKNSISYMLSRAAREENHLGVTDFVTYVNPNMGFTGSSYLASGWQLLGIEPGTKYRYVDSRYTTDRELAARFGRHDDAGYQRLLGRRFAISTMPLEPLLVFHTHISGDKSLPGKRER
jgi:hypothetical protein